MPASTHDLIITETVVVKRFVAWDRGEEEREWRALTALHAAAPGLAPEPLERRTVDGAPEIVMTRVPGEPLGEEPLTEQQVRALAEALRALHAAPVGDLPERWMGPAMMLDNVRQWLAEPHEPVGPEVMAALDAARAWVHSEEATTLCAGLAERCFTQADGNLANVLWDGERCRVVDFEDSGTSDPAYEVADLVEHISAWRDDLLDVDLLVEALDLTAAQRHRLAGFRRLFGAFWLMMLLPGNPGHRRNPSGTLERQAGRLLDSLG